MSARVAVFGGTFDPVTHGHLDIMVRGIRLFDQVRVCVAKEGRQTLFTPEERVDLVRAALAAAEAPEGITVELFEGLMVEHARACGAQVLLRGVRDVSDLEYELQMAFANRGLAPDLETVLLPPSPGMILVSSSLVREVARLGGDVTAWVPDPVVAALEARR